MNSLLEPSAYYSDEIFNIEIEKIYNSSWIYLGHECEFLNNNDFKRVSFKGNELVVQNFRGDLKCFLNVCSHRHSRIQLDREGNRPFFCPYHGWGYNKDGIPSGIPKKPLFNYSREDLDCLKLKSYEIDRCGRFLFARMDKCKIDLPSYLGEYFEKLDEISNAIYEKIDVNRFESTTNWKIIVENTLESYHVNLIHEETFLKLGTSGMTFQFSEKHSSWITSLKESYNAKSNQRIYKHFSNDIDYFIDGYEHIHIFPNIMISSTFGKSFNISRVDPINSRHSNFQSEVFLSKYHANPIIEAFKEQLINFNRKVFEEDKAICEEVQIGSELSIYSGQLSQEEERVLFFQKAIKNYV